MLKFIKPLLPPACASETAEHRRDGQGGGEETEARSWLLPPSPFLRDSSRGGCFSLPFPLRALQGPARDLSQRPTWLLLLGSQAVAGSQRLLPLLIPSRATRAESASRHIISSQGSGQVLRLENLRCPADERRRQDSFPPDATPTLERGPAHHAHPAAPESSRHRAAWAQSRQAENEGNGRREREHS